MSYPKNISQEELKDVLEFFEAATVSVAGEMLMLERLINAYQDYVYVRGQEKVFLNAAVNERRFRGCLFALGITVKRQYYDLHIPNHKLRDDWDHLNRDCWPETAR